MNFQKWIQVFLVMALLSAALSLATPAQAIGPADKVIWCPVAVTIPAPGQHGCTNVFPTLDQLVVSLTGINPAKAGTIWIGKDYNSATVGDANFVLDGLGLGLTHMRNYPLIIKGGWNGLTKGTLSLTRPSTFDGTTIYITNWIGSVSVRNIQVRVTASTTDTCYTTAVCVYTAGKITLDRVLVNGNNTFLGAELDNRDSASSPPASVTVTNSQFMDPTYDNLLIYTKGAVTLQNVESYNAAYGGVFIDNTDDTTASPVSVTNGQFNAAGDDGLYIYSNGPVTLTNLRAQDNGGDGIYVDNTSGSGNVLLKGTNIVQGNGGAGLEVYTNGKVSAERLVAYKNGGHGVYIEAENAVTISGSGKFDSNSNAGLYIQTLGPITASSLTAAGNGDSGLVLGTPATGQAVTLTRVTTSHNSENGVMLITEGKITLSCGTAYDNAAIGIFVSNFAGSAGAAGLKLLGFRSYFNGMADNLNSTPVVPGACP